MTRAFLCAISVALCASVVDVFRGRFTTEAQRITEVHRVKQSFDLKVFYQKNCEECHGASAEKRFNPDSPESQMIDSILNGATAEGSRDMPAYSAKGIDEPKAKALIAYMK